ncbi:hypothetical protein [Lactobacillus paragasseri]|uniref:Transposase n=1 Tax=Lactobacillus paragasseri TaxID=2107999 RepID=A0ABD4ZZ91_9LACO|nr:hypothetical protein [Lactobacillus paragasseri]MDK7952172.1 hypothetical protein [Lactobacillus paragasseri]MDO6360826.1 hypothetical protein [Lactobacillus paragasseri]
MRKRDRLQKKRAKVALNKAIKKFRKALQGAHATGTPEAYFEIMALNVLLQLQGLFVKAQLMSIARRYKKENRSKQ